MKSARGPKKNFSIMYAIRIRNRYSRFLSVNESHKFFRTTSCGSYFSRTNAVARKYSFKMLCVPVEGGRQRFLRQIDTRLRQRVVVNDGDVEPAEHALHVHRRTLRALNGDGGVLRRLFLRHRLRRRNPRKQEVLVREAVALVVGLLVHGRSGLVRRLETQLDVHEDLRTAHAHDAVADLLGLLFGVVLQLAFLIERDRVRHVLRAQRNRHLRKKR